jgi:hypothetical protein
MKGAPRGSPGRSSATSITLNVNVCPRTPMSKVSPSAIGCQSVGRRREMTTGIGRCAVPASASTGAVVNAAGFGAASGAPASTAA